MNLARSQEFCNGAPGQAPESPASAYIGSKAGFASISDGRYEGQRDNGSRFSGTVDRAPTRDLTEKVTEINAATEAVRDLRNAQREAQGYRPVGQRSTNPVHVAPNSHADQWNAKRLANDMKNDMKGMRPRAAAAYMMGRKPAPARTPQAEPEQPREPRPANDYYTKRQFEQQDAAAERTQEASLAAAEAQASAAEKAAELMADEQSATRQHTRALEIEGINQNGLDKRAQADRSAKVDDAVYKGLADQFAGDGLTEDPALHERAGVAQGMAGQLLKAYPGRFSAGQLTAAISNATRTMPTLADAENEARAQGGSDEEIQIRASEIYRGYQDSAAQSINKTLGL